MPPSVPRQIGSTPTRDPATWGVDTATHTLPANSDVRVNRDKAGRVAGVWREDVFGRLFARGTASGGFTQPDLDAVRRLQKDLAIRGRVAGGGGLERVDAGREPGSGLDNAVAAGRRVELVLSKLAPRARAILLALCDPLDFRSWRSHVHRLTGLSGERPQVRAVKRVARALADAYGYVQPAQRGALSLGQMNARSG